MLLLCRIFYGGLGFRVFFFVFLGLRIYGLGFGAWVLSFFKV